MKASSLLPKNYVVSTNRKICLKDYAPDYTDSFEDKAEAQEKLEADSERLETLQGKLNAQNVYALLVIIQGIDAAGKDSTIKHVLAGVNPSSCQVKSFKQPSTEELDHDYLWRSIKALPERGNIGIFNRSYYEEVLVVRVHPELLEKEHLPMQEKSKNLWSERFEQINNFERYLVQNGVEILKCFLHLSKKEQKKRFLSRIESPEKHWKFNYSDIEERAHWDEYQTAFEEMLSNTGTKHAPWHIIPADHKWFTHAAVADLIVRKLDSLPLHYPRFNKEDQTKIDLARRDLEKEKA